MLALKIIGLVIIILFLSFSYISLKENEKRASFFFLSFAVLFTAIYIVFPMVYAKSQIPLLIFTIVLFSFLLIIFLPIDPYRVKHGLMPGKQIDERDTMFSRKELQPGSKQFEAYYLRNTAKKTEDDKFRERPGLLSTKSQKYHPIAFSAAEAGFQTVDHFREHVGGKKAEETHEPNPGYMSTFLIEWAKKLGAYNAGICELKDLHWYSCKGRGAEYGDNIEPEHKYAIAFTVEMEKAMVDAAPTDAIVMEAGTKYVD